MIDRRFPAFVFAVALAAGCGSSGTGGGATEPPIDRAEKDEIPSTPSHEPHVAEASDVPLADGGDDQPVEKSTGELTKAPVGEAPAGEPPGISCLRAAYGQFIDRVETDPKTSRLRVVLTDGSAFPWEDGVENKSFDQLLNEPDIEDQFSIPYPAGRDFSVPGENQDPGRIRVEGFFKSVYGKNADEVRGNLVDVVWMPDHAGKKLKFNKRNGAATALERVSAELDADLPAALRKYVTTTSGTFNWRKIAGTKRLSVHSFAIAIDINVEYSDYWRWGMKRSPKPVYKNRIPIEIAEVFERHGFIWGGKWYHYDTMHFEYRPELLGSPCQGGKP